jgi:hypothetical protein
MAAARVALALVVVASAAQTGGAEPCAPRAELGGDAEAVARVAAELKRLGVEARTNPADATNRTILARTSCPVIVAAVELDRGGGIAVAVRDASQRSEGRVVSDAALAAAWIDSWLRDDFAAPAVDLGAPGVDPTPPGTTPPGTTPPIEPIAPVADTRVLDQFSLAASFLQAWSDDSTRWSGVAASACVRVGGLCVGGRLGYAIQDVAADLTAAAKRDLSLLATASYSYDVGRMSAAPELGLGVGRLATSRIEGCKMMDPSCDPTDPMCVMPQMPVCETSPGTVYVGDSFSATTYTPRLSAALRIAVPLFDHVWLDGLAAATLAPFGHEDPYAVGPDGTVMPNGNAFPLPGDPMLGVQLGIGLRLGAP